MKIAVDIQEISKAFPGVQALDSVSLQVREGEVHAIVGENGAGKSTLIKILAGALAPDKGRVLVYGQEVRNYNPEFARKLGIAVIYQDFNLIPHLNAPENISLGREPGRFGWIKRSFEFAEAKALFTQLGIELPLRIPVYRLTIAQQQLVEIAKALALNAKILIMDEPTSALSLAEREILFHLINRLRARGITIIYVTHYLDEVFRLADRVTVLKDGQVMGTLDVAVTDRDTLITMMIGRKLSQVFPSKTSQIGEPVLEVRNLSSGREVRDVSFKLHKGEILGIYGLAGAGCIELCKALFGSRPYSGQIFINGREVKVKHPYHAKKYGLALVSEDRKSEGLFLNLPVRHNLALPSLEKRQRFGIIKYSEETRSLKTTINALDVRPPDVETLSVQLSGGNQQKVVIGKWLLTNSQILICAEPTQGIDVGAKVEIYTHLRRLAEQGVAILLISSELPEVLGMSDRILVMNRGRIVAEFSSSNANEENVMSAALADRAEREQEAVSNAKKHRYTWLQQHVNVTSVTFATLLALFLAGILSSSRFLTMGNLIALVRSAVPLGLIAMGQAMVMIAGGVDLSVGTIVTLTTIIGAIIISGKDTLILPAVAVTLGLGLGLGCLNGIFVTVFKVPPFIATLGMMSVIRGIVLIVTRGPVGAIGPRFRLFSRGSIGPIPNALLILSLWFGIAFIIMRYTKYGRHLFAIGGNREVARRAGIKINLLELSSYLISSLSAVIAGVYMISRMGAGDPTVGQGLELDSIIAVLIGGIPFGGGQGSILGVMAGVMLLTLLSNLISIWNLSTWYHQIARALVLLVALSLFRRKVV